MNVALAEERRAVVEVGQRDVGPDAGVLEGDDVLDGAVGRVAGHLVRAQLAPEADPPEQVPQRHVLHHVGRGHQRGEDDARLAAVDDVVVVVAQGWCRRRSRIGVASGSVGLTRKSVVRR